MIEVSKASFYYPNTDEGALNDVSLQINSGECVVLCGKSGCGKTTLTRLLNGLAPSFFDGKRQKTGREKFHARSAQIQRGCNRTIS